MQTCKYASWEGPFQCTKYCWLVDLGETAWSVVSSWLVESEMSREMSVVCIRSLWMGWGWKLWMDSAMLRPPQTWMESREWWILVNLLFPQSYANCLTLNLFVPQVEITLQDINDNPPVFPTDILDVTVQENVGDGFRIMQITATDADEVGDPLGILWNTRCLLWIFLLQSGMSPEISVKSHLINCCYSFCSKEQDKHKSHKAKPNEQLTNRSVLGDNKWACVDWS